MAQPFFFAAVANSGRAFDIVTIPGDAEGTIGTLTLSSPTGAAEGDPVLVPQKNTLMVCDNYISYSTASTTSYGEILGRWRDRTTNEERAQIRIPKAGVMRRMMVYIRSNARTSDTIMRLRVNGADSPMSVTVPAGGTGWFEAVGEAPIAAGDLVNYSSTRGTGSGAIVIQRLVIEFEAEDAATTFFARSNLDTLGVASAGVFYNAIHSYARTIIFNWESSATATDASNRFGATGVFSHARVRVISNTLDVDATLTLMKNGAPTAISLTFPAGGGAAVYTEDVTEVACAPGDNFGWRLTTTGRTAGTLIFGVMEIMFTSDDGTWDLVTQGIDDQDSNGVSSSVNYAAIGGQIVQPSAVEADNQVKFPFEADLSRFRVTAVYNSGVNSVDMNVVVRINGVDTDMNIAIPASAFNTVTPDTDTVDTAGISAGDLLGLTWTAGPNFQPGPRLYGITVTSQAPSYPYALPISNAGAETGDITNWSALNATYPTVPVAYSSFGGTTPHSGSYFFVAGGDVTGVSITWWGQTITLNSALYGDIDAGKLEMSLSAWHTTDGTGEIGYLLIDFLDASNNLIGRVQRTPTTPTTWSQEEVSLRIPEGTRKIRPSVRGVPTFGGASLDIYWDDFAGTISEASVPHAYIYRDTSMATTGWTQTAGTLETVSAFSGGIDNTLRWSSPSGGVGAAYRDFDISAYETAIDGGNVDLYLRYRHKGDGVGDTGRTWIEFYDETDTLLGSRTYSDASAVEGANHGTLKTVDLAVPTSARKVRLGIEGNYVNGFLGNIRCYFGNFMMALTGV